MPKKTATGSAKKAATAASKKPSVEKVTAVRYSSIPKESPTVKKSRSKSIPDDLVSERAYFISISGNGSSQDENWFRAERELREGL